MQSRRRWRRVRARHRHALAHKRSSEARAPRTVDERKGEREAEKVRRNEVAARGRGTRGRGTGFCAERREQKQSRSAAARNVQHKSQSYVPVRVRASVVRTAQAAIEKSVGEAQSRVE